jgi:branched-chain amino acid transport system ATP-binding protein/branched-chain amino acid transport system permease protein
MALLETEGLSINFGGVAAIADVSISVQPGEIHGVIGPNGAGKTSFINAVTGFVRARQGRIRFDGADVTGLNAESLSARGLGRTFQHAELFGECTLLENVLTGFYRHQRYGVLAAVAGFGKAARIENQTRKQAAALLAQFGLADLAQHRARDLPFGLQKRADMARALAAKPKLLLLDEPVSGMSEGEADDAAASIKRLARELGITLVVVEHNMRILMSLATTVTVLAQGRVLASGRPDEIRANPEVIRAYLGEDA